MGWQLDSDRGSPRAGDREKDIAAQVVESVSHTERPEKSFRIAQRYRVRKESGVVRPSKPCSRGWLPTANNPLEATLLTGEVDPGTRCRCATFRAIVPHSRGLDN